MRKWILAGLALCAATAAGAADTPSPKNNPGLGSIALIIMSGILYMAAILLYLQALRTEEASVVAPFFQAGPLFGYVLAYLVLGETLTPRQMAGGLLITCLSFQRSALSLRGLVRVPPCRGSVARRIWSIVSDHDRADCGGWRRVHFRG